MKAQEFIEKTKTCWPSVSAAIVMVWAVSMVIGLGVPLLSAIMTDQGVSPTIIGLNGTIGGLATIIGAICLPYLSKHFRIAPLILSMLLLGALSFFGFYLSQNMIIWFILRFILHFSMAILFILSECWINHSVPNQQRGFALSLYSTALGLGFAIGPTIFSLVGKEGIWPFLTGVLLVCCAAIPIVLSWRISPCFHHEKRAAFLHYIFTTPTATFAVFIFGAVQIGAITLLVPFITQLNYSDITAGHFLTFMALGNILLLIPLGILSDWIKNRYITLILCALIGFIGAAFIPQLAQNPILLGLDLFLLGGVVSGLYTTALTVLGSKYKGKELTSANSAFIFCYGLGTLVGPLLIGRSMSIPSLSPYGFSWSITALFALYIIMMVYRFMKKRLST